MELSPSPARVTAAAPLVLLAPRGTCVSARLTSSLTQVPGACLGLGLTLDYLDAALAGLCEARTGFDTYHHPGPPCADGRPSGGLVTLVRKGVSHRFGDVLTMGAASFQLLWLRYQALVNLYASPGHEEDLCGGFLDLHIKNQLHNKQWLLGGDSNAASQDSRFADLVLSTGASLCTDHRPTRWESDRCIDWFASTTGANLQWVGHSGEVFSDHIMIQALFPQPGSEAELRKGRLRPMPSWEKPADALRRLGGTGCSSAGMTT